MLKVAVILFQMSWYWNKYYRGLYANALIRFTFNGCHQSIGFAVTGSLSHTII
jgi:hypothetical protein